MADGSDLIGLPFRYGAHGPDAFDCYGLVMEMSRRNSKPLPDFGFSDNQAMVSAMMGATMPQWVEIDPQPGAIALIRIGRFVSHVGYLLNHYQMIHAWDRSHGVSVVKIEEWRHRILGYYKYVGH